MKWVFLLFCFFFFLTGLSANPQAQTKKKDEPPQKDHYYKDSDDMDQHFEDTLEKNDSERRLDDVRRRPKKS